VYGAADWRETKYEEVVEQEYLGLVRRRQVDPALTVADIEPTEAPVHHGRRGLGRRGELQDTVMAATIAAYESFIFDWKKER
jgi:hypothetical protein